VPSSSLDDAEFCGVLAEHLPDHRVVWLVGDVLPEFGWVERADPRRYFALSRIASLSTGILVHLREVLGVGEPARGGGHLVRAAERLLDVGVDPAFPSVTRSASSDSDSYTGVASSSGTSSAASANASTAAWARP